MSMKDTSPWVVGSYRGTLSGSNTCPFQTETLKAAGLLRPLSAGCPALSQQMRTTPCVARRKEQKEVEILEGYQEQRCLLTYNTHPRLCCEGETLLKFFKPGVPNPQAMNQHRYQVLGLWNLLSDRARKLCYVGEMTSGGWQPEQPDLWWEDLSHPGQSIISNLVYRVSATNPKENHSTFISWMSTNWP